MFAVNIEALLVAHYYYVVCVGSVTVLLKRISGCNSIVKYVYISLYLLACALLINISGGRHRGGGGG